MFNFNPTQVSANLEVFAKGDYEVILNEPKPYFQAGKPNAQTGENYPDSEGLMWTLRIAEGEHKSKPIIFRPNFNNEFGPQQAKSLLVAANGFPAGQEGEQAYNASHSTDDFSYSADPENVHIGQAWVDTKGKRVIVSLDVTMGKGDNAGKIYQQFKGFKAI